MVLPRGSALHGVHLAWAVVSESVKHRAPLLPTEAPLQQQTLGMHFPSLDFIRRNWQIFSRILSCVYLSLLIVSILEFLVFGSLCRFLLFLLHLFVCAGGGHLCPMASVCRSDDICGSVFSPLSWVLRIKLRPSGPAASTFTPWAISSAGHSSL